MTVVPDKAFGDTPADKKTASRKEKKHRRHGDRNRVFATRGTV